MIHSEIGLRIIPGQLQISLGISSEIASLISCGIPLEVSPGFPSRIPSRIPLGMSSFICIEII